MVTPRTGRPRGRPSTLKACTRDPDRHVLALAGLFGRLYPQLDFEHAVLAALAILHGEPVALPAEPLRQARRLKLTRRQIRKLEQGWRLEKWGTPEEEGRDGEAGTRAAERLRKKIARVVGDRGVTRWRGLMGLAWGVWLAAQHGAWPVDGPSAEAAIRTYAGLAGEAEFARAVMLPRLQRAVPAAAASILNLHFPE
jgi:hypothetical protein